VALWWGGAVAWAGETAGLDAARLAATEAIGSGDGRIHVIPSIAPYSLKNGETLTVTAIVRSERPVASVTADLAGLATVTLQPNQRLGGVSAEGTTGIWTAEWVASGLEEKVYAATLTVTDTTGHSWTDHSLTFSDPAAGHSTPGTTAYPRGEMKRLGAETLPNESDLGCVVMDPVSGYAYFGTGTSPGRVVKVALGSSSNPPTRVGSITLQAGEDYLRCAVIDTANGYAYFGSGYAFPGGRVVKVALGVGSNPPTRVGALILQPDEDRLACAVIDTANGYAYFGRETYNDGVPGRVIKVALGAGSNPPTRVGALTLDAGEDRLLSAVIDAASGYAYFGTNTIPGRVVKISLGEGSNPPTRVGSVTLGVDENALISAVIDPAKGYAYFGTNTIPSRVVKVSLGNDDDPPTRVGSTILNAGEDSLWRAVIDVASDYAYFASYTIPGRVVKVSLGSGSNLPTRIGAISLNGDEDRLYSAAIDATNGYAYFGTNTSPGRVVKVALEEGSNPPTRAGGLTLVYGEAVFTSAVIDPDNGYAYFGSDTSPGRVVKMALGGGSNPPTRVGAVTLEAGEERLKSAVIDAANGYAYFGSDTLPGRVIKVALGQGNGPPTRVGAVTLDTGENSLYSAVMDPANGYAYFGTMTSPGRVVKVALGEGSTPPTRAGALTLEAGEGSFGCAVIDTANGYAYFGRLGYYLDSVPGHIVKVALGEGSKPPTRVGAVTLESDENSLGCAVIDPANGYAYFGTLVSTTVSTPGRVVKVALGEGSSPPMRAGAVTLEAGETLLTCAVIDPSKGYACFGVSRGSGPSRVVKVALGNGSNPPTRTGALTLDADEQYLYSAVIDPANGCAYVATSGRYSNRSLERVVKVSLGSAANPFERTGAVTFKYGVASMTCAVVDAANGYAYFGAYADRVVKVALGSGSNPPMLAGVLTLDPGEGDLRSAVIDATSGYAYFGTETSPGRVVKVALGDGNSPPTRVGTLTLEADEGTLYSAVIDAADGFAYFGTFTSPGRVVKVALGEGSTLPTRVGAVTLDVEEEFIYTGVIDPANGYAYFGTDTFPGRVVKVALGNGSNPPERVGALIFDDGEGSISSGVIDSVNGYAYFSTGYDDSFGRVVKVALGSGNSPPTRAGALTLEEDENGLFISEIDPANGYAYFGASGSPGRVVKIALGSGGNPPTRAGALTLDAGYGDLSGGSVIDPANGYAYFATDNRYANPSGRVVKVRLGEGDSIPTDAGTLEFEAGENSLASAVIDSANGFAYFGTYDSPGRVVKVALGEGSNPPARIGTLILESGENGLRCAVIDSAKGYAYFGAGANPGRVVKVALGEGSDPPTRAGTLTLDVYEQSIYSAVIDATNGYGYFGIGSDFAPYARVVKVALGEGSNPPTRVGTLGLDYDDGGIFRAATVIDPGRGYAYFGTYKYQNPPRVVKVALGEGSNLPTRVGALILDTNDGVPYSAVIDPASGFAYLSTRRSSYSVSSSYRRIVKVALGEGSSLPTRVGALTLDAGAVSLSMADERAVIDPANGHAFFATGNDVMKVVLGSSSDLPTYAGTLTLEPSERPISSAVLDAAKGNAYFGTNTAPGLVVKVSIGLGNSLRATRFILPDPGDVTDVRFYSHAPVGNVRLALYDNAEPKNLLWESGVVANSADEADLIVPVGEGTPSSLHLSAGTYWAAWQVDSAANVPSYTPGVQGEGFSFAQAFGPAPATLARENIVPTSDRWTMYMVYVRVTPTGLVLR